MKGADNPMTDNDPMLKDLEVFAKQYLSRRQVLAGAGAVGAATMLNLSPATAAGQVRWANWGLYLDFDNKTKKYPTLEDFQKQTGIKATYQEAVDDNDSFTAKVTPQLKLKKDIGYDAVVLTAWMAQRWIASGFTQKFDAGAIPNKKNVIASQANVSWDPGRNNSLPYAGVIAGLAWNKALVPKGLKTVDDLFKPANKGRIEVLSDRKSTRLNSSHSSVSRMPSSA